MKRVEVIDTGRTEYIRSYELQQDLVKELEENPQRAGYLVVTEPEPTITKGIRGGREEIFFSEEELSRQGIEVVDIRRGGRVTFHGPGQIVIYPVLNLKNFKKSIKWYIESLEETVIETLREMGIKAHKREGIVGIFGERGKICAIGIEVKRWKTLHGIAINHQVDLRYFSGINPCGIGQLGVSSMVDEGVDVERERVVEVFRRKFSEIFSAEVVEGSHVEDCS